jgi:protein involved in polysaccharide export with SLBB domain
MIILLTFVIPLNAQLQSNISLPDLLKMRPDVKPDASQISVKSVPLDAPVDPAEYYAGPGDVFVLNVWSSMPVEHQVTVTPEATLLIPNVGVIDVREQTLQSVKKSVATVVGKKYPTAEVTLNLVAPRKIVVQVTGDVFDEGKYEVNALQRVDNLIALANTLPPGVSDKKLYEEISRTRVSSSLRNIIIQRKSGVKLRADLIKYMATGEGKYNPYLREGDQVLVPGRLMNAIGMLGAVRLPSGFEYVPGDSLTDLIAMGFGFKAAADSMHGVLTRLSADANSMEKIDVNPAAIVAGKERNIALRPGDQLTIKEVPESRQSLIVAIEGEVKQPGQYPITRSATKLSEAIKAAGGFTNEANIKAATLIRARVGPQVSPDEIAQEQLLSSRSNLGIQDTSYYFTETALRLKGELVSVDFQKLFVLGDSTQDVTLRLYDRVIIPRRTRTVYVFGQVLSPGHIEFVEGKDYRYYVEKATGYMQDAREGDVKIIKGSTRIWLDPDETKIEDGDYIWVPKERQYPFSYYLTTYAQVAGIIGTVATVALLIKTLQ